jgi:broad specificity phosphatase PhoE
VSTSIYLVRHGRTALNAQGRFRGRQDVPLDDRGFVDAAGAARALADVKLAAVYTSPLLRTRQTAEFVAGPSSARVIEEPDLIDLDHGRWEALTAEEAAALDPAAFDRFRSDPRNAEPPSGERMADVERRVLAALTRIGRRHDGSAVAAVSHEIPIRLVIANLAGIDGSAFWAFALPTGAVTELRFERDRLELVGEAPTGAEG